MKIRLISIAQTDSNYLKEGISIYVSRLKHYVNFEYVEIAAPKGSKNLTQPELKKREGEYLLKEVDTSSVLILLDERGKEYASVGFSKFIQQQMNSGVKTVVFFIGGPFGFSDEVYKRANHKVSLSQMTFSHQMVRLFFVEQLYRTFTIIKGESYHHE
jgi:23S rRNA (pseudouridine1915-N3)-methyltransferase